MFNRPDSSSFDHPPRFPNLRLYVLLLLSRLCESIVLNITYVDPESSLVVQEQLAMVAGESEHVTGIVVPVQACQPLDTDALPPQPFIALIENGGCRDQVKLRHVAQANAAAALLYNDNLSTSLLQGIPIAFAVINQKNGEWLANLIANGTRVWMQMETFEDDQTHPTVILFVSVAFIILMIFSFAWLIQRFRYIPAKQILSRHLCSAGKNALDKIPVKTVKRDNRGLADDCECSICIEPFQYGEQMRTLPCNHCFHKVCIDPWLLEQRSCPMCKMDIILHFGLVYTGSEESVLEIDAEEFRRHRASVLDDDIVQRRHSGVRVSMSREGASVTSLDPDASATEHSFNGAGNTSEIEYESNEERWTNKSQSYEICDQS